MDANGSVVSVVPTRVLDAHQATKHAIHATYWKMCSKSFPFFLFAFCKTKDEHDPKVVAKPYPLKIYIAIVAIFLQSTRRLAIPKSRQLMMSWTVAAFVLWVALFRDNSLNFLQSKKETDANALLERVFDIYIRLPNWMQKANPVNPSKNGERIENHMRFPWTMDAIKRITPDGEEPDLGLLLTLRAHIWAIPQGQDVLRQYTATFIFSDEDAFQEQAALAYQASAPILADDSWFIKVSTANPGHFESVVKDKALEV